MKIGQEISDLVTIAQYRALYINTAVRYIYLHLRLYTRWFKYDRDDLCVNKSQFVPVIFEPPCIYTVDCV
jgi:hypothetical protein